MMELTVTLFVFIVGVMLAIKMVNIIGQVLVSLFEKVIKFSGNVIIAIGSIWVLLNMMN
nr:hypothetical protein [Oscillochloris trichoides]